MVQEGPTLLLTGFKRFTTDKVVPDMIAYLKMSVGIQVLMSRSCFGANTDQFSIGRVL